jgi:hypothetical protein
MNKFIEILAGLVLLLAPIYAWIINLWGFGDAALLVLKGGIVWGLLFIGIVFLILGISDLKS